MAGLKKFIKGTLFGGILGALAGLFLAPKSGKELREEVKEKGEELKEKFEDVKGKVEEKFEELKEEIKEEKK